MINDMTPQQFELWAASDDHATPARVVGWWAMNGPVSHAVCVATGERGVRLLGVTSCKFYPDEAAALAAA